LEEDGESLGEATKEDKDTEQEEDDANNDDEKPTKLTRMSPLLQRKSATKSHKGETVSEIILVFIDLIFCVLTALSAIYQLYHGYQF
jgi:hypothetical protein